LGRKSEQEADIKKKVTLQDSFKNGFSELENESSSDDEEFDKTFPNVTVRKKLALQIPKSWSEWSDSDDD